MLVAALLVMGIVPATANATPTVTATNDAGTPVTLIPGTPTGIRQMDVSVTVAVPSADTKFFQAQVFDGGGLPATPMSDCFDRGDTASLKGSPSYHGNGTYTVLVRYASNATCSAVTRDSRFQYAISAGAAVTPPPGKLLTRKPNSFVITTFPLGVTLNPGAISYEIRYKRNGVVQPDGSLAGTTKSAFVDTTSGLANFSFDKPGRYVIGARSATASSPAGARRRSSTRSRRSTSAASSSPTTRARATSCAGGSASTPRAARSRSIWPRARRAAASTSSARPRSARRASSRSASRCAAPAPTACGTSSRAAARSRPAA
jgi:hypothetical protein